MSQRYLTGWWTAVVLTAALMVLAPASLAAQDSFAYVQYILRPGDTVFVTDEGGAESRGRVIDVGPSALRITLQNGTEREWSEAAVRLLERRAIH